MGHETQKTKWRLHEMKRTMNRPQRVYMTAKAHLETLEEEVKRIEQEYISAHEIKNADGTTPERIYCIMDEATFDRANEETGAEIVARGLEAEINAARQTLTAAEDALISYALTISPAGIRSTLERGAQKDYRVRQKLIDLVFRLDVSTVPR